MVLVPQDAMENLPLAGLQATNAGSMDNGGSVEARTSADHMEHHKQGSWGETLHGQGRINLHGPHQGAGLGRPFLALVGIQVAVVPAPDPQPVVVLPLLVPMPAALPEVKSGDEQGADHGEGDTKEISVHGQLGDGCGGRNVERKYNPDGPTLHFRHDLVVEGQKVVRVRPFPPLDGDAGV